MKRRNFLTTTAAATTGMFLSHAEASPQQQEALLDDWRVVDLTDVSSSDPFISAPRAFGEFKTVTLMPRVVFDSYFSDVGGRLIAPDCLTLIIDADDNGSAADDDDDKPAVCLHGWPTRNEIGEDGSEHAMVPVFMPIVLPTHAEAELLRDDPLRSRLFPLSQIPVEDAFLVEAGKLQFRQVLVEAKQYAEKIIAAARRRLAYVADLGDGWRFDDMWLIHADRAAAEKMLAEQKLSPWRQAPVILNAAVLKERWAAADAVCTAAEVAHARKGRR